MQTHPSFTPILLIVSTFCALLAGGLCAAGFVMAEATSLAIFVGAVVLLREFGRYLPRLYHSTKHLIEQLAFASLLLLLPFGLALGLPIGLLGAVVLFNFIGWDVDALRRRCATSVDSADMRPLLRRHTLTLTITCGTAIALAFLLNSLDLTLRLSLTIAIATTAVTSLIVMTIVLVRLGNRSTEQVP